MLAELEDAAAEHDRCPRTVLHAAGHVYSYQLTLSRRHEAASSRDAEAHVGTLTDAVAELRIPEGRLVCALSPSIPETTFTLLDMRFPTAAPSAPWPTAQEMQPLTTAAIERSDAAR